MLLEGNIKLKVMNHQSHCNEVMMTKPKFSKEIQESLERMEDGAWYHHTRIALEWFLSYLKEEDWNVRKGNVVNYFREQEDKVYQNHSEAAEGYKDEKNRVAFHEDWVAWYLFLVECLHHRPLVSEMAQSARVFPFFSAIGRHIDIAKDIKGIDNKLNELLNGKMNQPDSTLFELVVAIMYARNGYSVEFIPETALNKTPDLKVTREKESYFVECKRLAKITEYAHSERQQWSERWFKLVPLLAGYKYPIFVDVVFKVEIQDTDKAILVNVFNRIKSKVVKGKILKYEDEEIVIHINVINMDEVNNHFEKYFVKWNSPQMVSLLAGGFNSSYNYSHLCNPKELMRCGLDKDYDVLNIFCSGINNGFCVRWECIAEESINKKAKDVKTHLSKAVRQAPDKEPTIIHISYETLHGPIVEINRANKIAESINLFDCGGKDIRAIYCHAFQPSVSEEDWEIAETTMRFGKNGFEPLNFLFHDLLLDEEDTIIESDTHWEQDISTLLK